MSTLALTFADEPPIANDWSLTFAHELTRQASDYWTACRHDRLMPVAKDMKPREMKAFLSHVSMVDVIRSPRGALDFRVRLAGERTRAVFGHISGKLLQEFLLPDVEGRWRLAFESVCAKRARVRNHGTVSFEGKWYLDFETLVAPLGETDVTDLFTVFVSWPREIP